ncbi:hypothetical protein EDD15DRAFT_2440988 [Pisolithus albus]|nr:hypothetical protein EDD15DRAFT_2440988 [Pisolithus albus]
MNHFLDWSKLPAMPSVPELLSQPFDVIFGADIVDDVDHAVWIKKCLEWLLRGRPSTSVASAFAAVFHLVIRLRPTHTLEANSIETTFRWTDDISNEDHPELAILSKETILCEAYTDGDAKRGCGVIEYLYYRIGWSRQD